MAEVAGLAVGVASLGSLFSTCVELAEYISLARKMGSDYEASYTKFLLLRSRLVASGTQLKIAMGEQSRYSISDRNGDWQSIAIRCLLAIKGLLEDVNGLESKYGLRSHGEGDGLRLELQQQHSLALQEVERGLQSSVKQRQRKTRLGRKIVWAIRDRKAFDRLINDLAFHVNELEHLAQRSAGDRNLGDIMPELPTNMSPAAIQLLEAAASDPDMKQTAGRDGGASGNAVASAGHLYLRNQIREHARVLQGDVGEGGPHGRRHVFEDNIISGGSKVVQGNVAYDFMDDFWKD